MRLVNIALALLVSMNSFETFAEELNIKDAVDGSNQLYYCNVWSDGELEYEGEGQVVVDENVVVEEKSGKQFSVARIVFKREIAPIVMNLFYVPKSGVVEDLKLGYSRETHIRHAHLESYDTWSQKRRQILKRNTLTLTEGSESARVNFSEDSSGKIEMFQTRQILKDYIPLFFPVIPRTISDFKINCSSDKHTVNDIDSLDR